ncbi:hypothetical protein BD769DRAFT_1433670 [Suillus cothurnatus]|nr:hypothetical protein BD769DRAFT_1433670 [Suillus cothurnatus]
MPCLDDRVSLPYLDVILCEVLRWYSLGAPHAASNDDVYGGYFIPKGSMALSRDEDIRHLTAGSFVNHFAFGRWFAENSLWTAASTILAVLRIDAPAADSAEATLNHFTVRSKA